MKIAVVGCGVIGLSSALALQKALGPIADVTIYTEKESPNTTGDVSAGLWEPYLVNETPIENVNKWSLATFNYLLRLWKEGKANEMGISLLPIINLSTKNDYKLPDWIRYTLGYNEFTRDQLEKFGKEYKKKFTGGFMFVTFTWEPSVFLPVFKQEFLRLGGKIINKKISNLEELNDFDFIINCTGLNAATLVSDKEMFPVRGQIMRVLSPWQCHCLLMEEDNNSYIIPNINTTILGGTKQIDYNLSISEEDKQMIFANCSALVPALKSAQILKDQVGLRPSRKEVRLELESKNLGGKEVNIIHNYGHGGSGVTLSIGCAEDVVLLLRQVIGKNRSKI